MKRTDLFNGTWLVVAQLSVEAGISHGIVLRGDAMKMHKALKDFIAQNNVQSNYLSSGDEDKVAGLIMIAVLVSYCTCKGRS